MTFKIDTVYVTEHNYFVTSDRGGKFKYKWYGTKEKKERGESINLSECEAKRLGLNIVHV